MNEMPKKQENMINNMSPKAAFKSGLVGGIAIAFIIGFFILLGAYINKDKDDADNTNTNGDAVNIEAGASLEDIAKSIGLKEKKFNECLESKKHSARVKETSQQAQVAGAKGTPYSVILYKDMKVPIPGALPYTAIKPMLDSIIAGETLETNDANIDIQGIGDNDWVLGDKDAEITIIEFSDLDCSFCKRFHGTMHQVIDNYDNVNWAFRHFPLLQLHPDAANKAEASECAGDLGGNDKFWEFIDTIEAS